LTLEIGEDAESLGVAVLVEFRVIAALHLVRITRVNPVASLVPEARIIAGGIVVFANFEIKIAPVSLPDRLVFGESEGGGGIEVAIESNEIAEGCKRVILESLECPCKWRGEAHTKRTYMPRAWMASITVLHVSIVPKWWSRTVRSSGE
jgi:hypothetical protein